VLASPPVAVANDDGRLEVFVRGTDGALWRNSEVFARGGWAGWNSLGRPMQGEAFRGDPAVARNDDGRLELFVRGSNDQLYSNTQATAGGNWSGWIPQGGILRSAPAVGVNADGRLEVFVRGTTGGLYHMWQLNAGGPAWSGWKPLGGGGALTSDPAVRLNFLGGLEVFARWSTGAVYHMVQTKTTAGATTWSAWASLGSAPSGALMGTPAVGINADSGRLEIFARGTDAKAYHQYQRTFGGSWSGWYSMEGTLTSDLTVEANVDARLEVFARWSNGDVYHIYQVAPDSGWSAWSRV